CLQPHESTLLSWLRMVAIQRYNRAANENFIWRGSKPASGRRRSRRPLLRVAISLMWSPPGFRRSEQSRAGGRSVKVGGCSRLVETMLVSPYLTTADDATRRFGK